MAGSKITDVCDFDSDLVARVDAATVLVNALAIQHAGGRPVEPPNSDAERVALATATLLAVGSPRSVDLAGARGLTELAHRLAPIIAALIAKRFDDAELELNALLRDTHAVPHVHTSTAGAPWFLHFHTPEASLADGWGAGCAVGLAYLLSIRQTDRLGACDAPVCERVFLDLTRNHSRRFCSTGCQNRVKAASHRRRQAARNA